MALLPVFFDEGFFLPQVLGVVFGFVPLAFENGGGSNFVLVGVVGTGQLGAAVGSAVAFFVGGHGAGVFLAAAVVGVAPGPGEAHLDEFLGHVGAHKIVGLQICLKQAVNRGRRLGSRRRVAEALVGHNFALVGLHQQHALLAAAHTVQLGVLAEVKRSKIEGVIERHF